MFTDKADIKNILHTLYTSKKKKKEAALTKKRINIFFLYRNKNTNLELFFSFFIIFILFVATKTLVFFKFILFLITGKV